MLRRKYYGLMGRVGSFHEKLTTLSVRMRGNQFLFVTFVQNEYFTSIDVCFYVSKHRASLNTCRLFLRCCDTFCFYTFYGILRGCCQPATETRSLAKFHCAWWRIKATFHYASCFEAGSKLVADRFEAKFHYAIWFEACRRPASNQLQTSSEPAPNQLRTMLRTS